MLSGGGQLFGIGLGVGWVVIECCEKFFAGCEAGVDFYGDE